MAYFFPQGVEPLAPFPVTLANKPLLKGLHVVQHTEWESGKSDYNYARTFTWYTYALDESNSVYTLSPVDENLQLITAHNTSVNINSKDVRLDGENERVSPKVTSLRAYGNDDSVYITVDTDTIETPNDTNQVVIDEVTGIYTGVQNVDITSVKNANFGTVFALMDDEQYVIAAVVVGTDNGSTSNYAYIFSGTNYEEKIGDTYYWEFDAGTEEGFQKLTVKTKYQSVITTIVNTLASAKSTANGYLFKLSYDAEGYVVNAKLYDDATLAGSYIHATWNNNWNAPIGTEVVRYMDVTNAKGDELVLISNTLYNNEKPNDVGLPLHPDAKFIVAQEEYGKFTKTEYDSIEAALSALYDYDPNNNNPDATLDFNGTISAVLDSSGRATWVVFDSNGGFDADRNPSSGSGNSSIASVNVALSGNKQDLWLNMLDKNNNKVTTGTVDITIYWRSSSQANFDVFETKTINCADYENNAIVTGLPNGSSWYIVVEGFTNPTNTVTSIY